MHLCLGVGCGIGSIVVHIMMVEADTLNTIVAPAVSTLATMFTTKIMNLQDSI